VYKRCHGGVDPTDNPTFTCDQPGMCELGVDDNLLDLINILGIDPGKLNILTLSTGPKLTGVEYHAALRVAPTPATMTEKQTKMLNDAKEAEAARMLHDFNVLSFDGLWRAASDSIGADQAVCKTSVHEARTHCVQQSAAKDQDDP
jgi:hypothetical protein